MEFTFEENGEVETDAFEAVVPAEFRSFYAKGQDGKYRVAENMQAAAKAFDGLRGNLKKSSQTNQRVGREAADRRAIIEATAKALGITDAAEMTTEKLTAKVKELTDQIAQKAGVDPAEIRAAVEAEIRPQLEAANGERDAMFSTLREHLIDGELLRSIGEHKGNPKLLLPHLRDKMDVIALEDEGGKKRYVAVVKKPDGQGYRVGSDGNPLPPSKLVEEFKADKDYSMLFEGTKQSGTGTPPNNGQQHRQAAQPQGSELRGVSKIAAGLAQRS